MTRSNGVGLRQVRSNLLITSSVVWAVLLNANRVFRTVGEGENKSGRR